MLMDEKEKSPVCIPFFVHENMMMHYNMTVRRLVLVIIAVCLTSIITIAIFTSAYTTRERDRNNVYKNEIIAYIQQLHGMEAQDGIHQQSDAASYP